jgi:sRNA-binding carbon storage regulator CsrA
VKLGCVFPPTASVLRRELYERIKAERDMVGAADDTPITTPNQAVRRQP